mgnify:FL=1|tara:strand:- start:8 stop:682 length:675 start_codon:yes stop_codon:yes gene_type:complete
MVQKVNSKIVGYSIKKDAAVEQEKNPKKELMNEEIARPDELKGYTYKIKTPLSDHAMYITINNMVLNPGTEHEQEHPFEIFINSKNMEQFQWILALTRVISAVFRKGGDSAFLAEELKQVFDPQGGYFKKGGRFMPSLVAEIGEVLETHMKKIGLITTEALTEEHKTLIEEKRALMDSANSDQLEPQVAGYPPGSELCNKCNVKSKILMDGCMTCLNCGDSKCG